MPRTAIVVVDDADDFLDDLAHELDDRYGRHYDIHRAATPEQAIACFEELAAEGTEMAVLLVALPLIVVEGSRLLDESRRLHPHAMRALVIRWSDTGKPEIGGAILEAVASGHIDHYVLRPAGPSDELFHHAVSGLLLDWTEAQRMSPHTVHVVGESWSGRAYELRNVLGRCAMPHAFWLADSEDGRALVARAGAECDLPIVVMPDGSILHDPTNAQLAAASGSPVSPEHGHYDLVIVGAGPAGLSAAVYGASEGLTTLVVDEGGIGGQATSSSLIRN